MIRNRNEIEQDLAQIIRRLRPELSGEIRGADRLRDDLGLDSLHSMELLSEITEKYAIDVDMEQVAEIRTVSDVTQFLVDLTAGS
jgi:acyl carrier protein